MSKTAMPSKPLVPTSNYVSHYDPAKSNHRAWLQAVLDRQVERFGRHFLVPSPTEGFGLNAALLRVNRLAGDRAEEVPVNVLELA
jgi:hypothetical protein